MSIYGMPALLGCIAFLYPVVKCFQLRRSNKKAEILFLLSLEGMWCLLCEIFVITAHSPESGIFWDRMMYAAIILMPATLLQFALSYRNQKAPLYFWIPAFFFLFTLPTNHFIAGVEPVCWGWTKLEGPIFGLFKTYLLLYLLTYYYQSYQAYRSAPPKIKNEMRYTCIFSTFPPVAVGLLILIVFPVFGYTNANIMVFAVATVSHSLVVTYAITTDRLWDLDLSKRKRLLRKKLKMAVAKGRNLSSYQIAVAELARTFGCGITILSATGETFSSPGCTPAHTTTETWKSVISCPGILIRGESGSDTDSFLHDAGLDAILPILAKNELVAVVFFGAGLINNIYGSREMRLFKQIATNLRRSAYHFYCVNTISHIKANPVVIYQSQGSILEITTPHDLVRVVAIDCDEDVLLT
jgi:hypothetical protein